MNRVRVAALTRRIVAQFRRDPRSLALIVVLPVVLTALLGWIIRDQKVATTDLALVAQDRTAGPVLLAALTPVAQQAGVQISVLPDQAAAEQALRDGTANAALVIPEGFLAAERAGQQATLRVVTLGVDPASDAGHLMQVQQMIMGTVTSLAPGAVRPPQIDRATVYGSPDADMLDSFAPVMIGVFAYFFVFILTGISFLRERIGGTLERLLATPITRGEIVVGYSLGFGIFATIQVTILITFALMKVVLPAVGPVGLDIPCAGSPLLAFVFAVVLAIGAVNLGIFLSTFARTELQVLQFIPIVIVPQILLAGVFWPVSSLPDLLQPLARLMPVYYAADGLRDVMIRGQGIDASTIQLDLAVLLGIAVLFVVLAAGTIRREVA